MVVDMGVDDGGALANVAQSLLQGKAPRGRKSIRETIRECQRSGRYAEASYGSQLLAELELRHGYPDRALTSARTALRLCRKHRLDPARQDAALSQLTRICLHTGDEKRALAYAEERIEHARAQNYARGVIQGMMQAVLAHWLAGERSMALELAEQALQLIEESPEQAARARLLLAKLLLAAGCPATALDLATETYRQPLPDILQIRALLVRGAASMCLGRTDAAARDYRRARALARKIEDMRPQVEAYAALALAEARRAALCAGDGDGVAKADILWQRARSLIQRAERLAERLRDPRLGERVSMFRRWMETAVEDAPTALGSVPATCKEAAQALVDLAKQTHSLLLAEACTKEVMRMASHPEGEPPYYCAFQVMDLAEL